MIRRPPRSTPTYTLFPYTTLFRSRIHKTISQPIIITFFRGRSGRHKESFGLFVHSLFPMNTDLTLVRLAPFTVRHRIVNHRPFPHLTVLYLANHDISKAQLGPVSSAERRVGKASVSTCQSRWSPYK